MALDKRHRELTNEEDFRQVDAAVVVNIISTPWHGSNPTAGRKAADTKGFHDNPQAGIYTFNPNTGLRAAAAAAGLSEAEQGRRWLQLWTQVLHKVKKTRGTCFVMAKGTDEDNFELEGAAQHGEVEIAKGFRVLIEYVFYSSPSAKGPGSLDGQAQEVDVGYALGDCTINLVDSASAESDFPQATVPTFTDEELFEGVEGLDDPVEPSAQRALSVSSVATQGNLLALDRQQREAIAAQRAVLQSQPLYAQQPGQPLTFASVLPRAVAGASRQASAGQIVQSGPQHTALISSPESPGSPREMITLCLEGDLSAFDEAREARLRYGLAALLESEICRGPGDISIEKATASERLQARIGVGNCRIRVELHTSLRPPVAIYGSDSPGSPSSASSIEDAIYESVEQLTGTRVWPSQVGVDDIVVVWKGRGSVLAVLLLHPAAAHALFQLALQRHVPLIDEGIRCLKLGGCVAKLDDLGDMDECVRKVHEAEAEAIRAAAVAVTGARLSVVDRELLRSELDPEICRVILASNSFEVLRLEPAARHHLTSVNRAYRQIAHLIHPDKVQRRRDAKPTAVPSEAPVDLYAAPPAAADPPVAADPHVASSDSDEELAAHSSDAASSVDAATLARLIRAAPAMRARAAEQARVAAEQAAENLARAIHDAHGAEPGSNTAMQRLNEARSVLLDARSYADHREEALAGRGLSGSWERETLQVVADVRRAAEAKAQAKAAEKAARKGAKETALHEVMKETALHEVMDLLYTTKRRFEDDPNSPEAHALEQARRDVLLHFQEFMQQAKRARTVQDNITRGGSMEDAPPDNSEQQRLESIAKLAETLAQLTTLALPQGPSGAAYASSGAEVSKLQSMCEALSLVDERRLQSLADSISLLRSELDQLSVNAPPQISLLEPSLQEQTLSRGAVTRALPEMSDDEDAPEEAGPSSQATSSSTPAVTAPSGRPHGWTSVWTGQKLRLELTAPSGTCGFFYLLHLDDKDSELKVCFPNKRDPDNAVPASGVIAIPSRFHEERLSDKEELAKRWLYFQGEHDERESFYLVTTSKRLEEFAEVGSLPNNLKPVPPNQAKAVITLLRRYVAGASSTTRALGGMDDSDDDEKPAEEPGVVMSLSSFKLISVKPPRP